MSTTEHPATLADIRRAAAELAAEAAEDTDARGAAEHAARAHRLAIAADSLAAELAEARRLAEELAEVAALARAEAEHAERADRVS